MKTTSSLTISQVDCSSKYVKRDVADDIVYEFLQTMMDCVIDKWDLIPIGENVNESVDHKSIISDSTQENDNDSIRSLGSNDVSENRSSDEKGVESSDEKISKDSQNNLKNGESLHADESNQTSFLSTPSQRKIVSRKVKVELKNGCVYEGCISNWMMDGYGQFRWTDGSIYEGMFSNNEIQGIGKMKYPDLCWYEGQFLHGLRHGLGTFSITKSDTSYRGEWMFSKRHGKGRIIYNEKQYYDGEWYKDEFNGKGKRAYDDKTLYYGNWQEGKRDGYGRMCWSNNDFYSGEWFNGLMHGYGKYTWNGVLFANFVFQLDNTYKGIWKNGERDGFGTLVLGHLNGAIYEGNFHKNFKHGEGTIICGNGKIIHNRPLFQHDNPIHLFSTENEKHKFIHHIPKEQVITFDPMKFKYKLICECEDCQCDKNIIHEKDRILYCLEKTIYIPIHESVHTIDLSYHLLQISVKNIIQKNELHHILKRTQVKKEHDHKASYSSYSRNSLINVIKTKPPAHYQIKISPKRQSVFYERPILLRNPDDINREEHFIYNCFTLHLPRLWEIYEFYCNICCQDYSFTEMKYKRVMIRLFLWQMYRDCNIMSRLSLVKTDILLARNKAALMKSIHYPFEKIYFFQFLHSLLAVAWELYGENIDARTFGGSLLASVLHKFLQEDVYQNVRQYKHVGVVLFKYRDLAPLKSMYDFYQSIAEPMSVKQFIQLFVPSKLNKRNAILHNISGQKTNMFAGINAMVFNSKSYALRKDILWGNIDTEQCNELFENDKENATSLPHSLGILEIIDSLTDICPLVFTETLLNIEYKMNFLEFYETLIACLHRSFELKLMYERAKELHMAQTSFREPENNWSRSKKMKGASNMSNISSSSVNRGTKSKLFQLKDNKSSIKSKPSSVSKIVIKNYSTRSVRGSSK